ncbi:MAG: diaminopimelate epimerase [Cypionkella sp.]|uniref:hypothetical protein n=1 Tax=Cypionkella sp. TaxID=2811411 RepID=UPI00262426AC|nr:hypothetical protein [Cypionkella sp.]MDB5661130.1 diaminopimelate epimerase [Cypionkella sp.]
MNVLILNPPICATLVATHLRGLTGWFATVFAANMSGLARRPVTVEADSRTLNIDWRNDGVSLTGPTAHTLNGSFAAAPLAAL